MQSNALRFDCLQVVLLFVRRLSKIAHILPASLEQPTPGCDRLEGAVKKTISCPLVGRSASRTVPSMKQCLERFEQDAEVVLGLIERRNVLMDIE